MVILDEEAKHVFVGYGVLDEILVQTVAEDFLCGMSVYGILYEDRRAGEAEYLRVVEELNDVFMTFAEVAAVAFVEDHNDARMAYLLDATAIPLLADSGVELLYGCDDNLRIAVQALHQFVCIVSAVDRSWLESLVFGLSLRVKVVTVNHKHHLVYIVQLGNKLSSLKRSQGFACSSCMPDITIVVRVLHTVENLLHCIELIRAQTSPSR